MFRQGVQRTARQMSTVARTEFPSMGQGYGGHPRVLQQEGSVADTWFNMRKKPELAPVAAVVVFGLGLATYKLAVVDANAPDTHFNRKERSTLDYIENDRDARKAIAWGQTALHTGGALGKKAQQ